MIDTYKLPNDISLPIGETEQNVYEGHQLFNIKDGAIVFPEYSFDDDDWISLSYDNSNGTDIKYFNFYTNNLNIEENQQYAIILEVKDVTGEGMLAYFSTFENQGQFNSNGFYYFYDGRKILKDIATTRNSFAGIEYGVRTFIGFGAGQKRKYNF